MAKIHPAPGSFSDQSTAPFQITDLLHMETPVDVEELPWPGHRRGRPLSSGRTGKTLKVSLGQWCGTEMDAQGRVVESPSADISSFVQTEAWSTKCVLAIALLQVGGSTTQPLRSVPRQHFYVSAGPPKSPWRLSLAEVLKSHHIHFDSQFIPANTCQGSSCSPSFARCLKHLPRVGETLLAKRERWEIF